jgi:Rrf2 family cysteine metabolism transcriptional repressor
MKISQKCEYALSAMFDLSLHSPGDLVKVAGIASRQNIPEKFLEVILGNLKQRGLVTSKRGSKGGYRLARPADQITVGQVLECFGERKLRKGRAAFRDLWARLERSVLAILDETTFAELDLTRQGDANPHEFAGPPASIISSRL